MADEIRADDIEEVWRGQPTDMTRMSADELRRKTNAANAKMRRGLRVSALLMIASAAGYTSFLYFFPSALHRTAATVTLAGYLYCGYQLYRRMAAKKPDVTAIPTVAAYRAELEQQRAFNVEAWRRFLLPLVPGPALFIMAFAVPELGVERALALTTAIIASPSAFLAPLMRSKARMLQREIDDLKRL